MGPKKMLHIVIVCLLGYAFPFHALIAAILLGIGYYLYKKYNPFK
jgi:nitrate reductase gamma subunit